MRLTRDQDRAVRSWQRGDICVVAGPGSGKTRVLVERVRWLILDRDVPPDHVLAITFTEKAAHEMRSRLVSDGSPTSEESGKLEAANVSTIDAFCHRLLKENALAAGVDPAFEIVDESEGRDLLRAAIERVLDEAFVQGGGPLGAFLAAYGGSASRLPRADSLTLLEDLAGLVASIRSYGSEPFLREPDMPLAELASALRALADAKQLAPLADLAHRLVNVPGKDPDAAPALLREAAAATAKIYKRGKIKNLVSEVKDRLLPECVAASVSMLHRPARQWLLETVRRVLAEFEAAKLAAACMDFDDVLARAAELLGSDYPPRLHFEHILIDEFQDTNPLQIQLVERLLDAHGPSRPVRFVVGDINQSIYGFRHADQNVFREYRERIEGNNGEVIRLAENFRSRPEVLGAVHRLLPGGPRSGVEKRRLQSASAFPERPEPSVEVQIVTDGRKSALEREGRWLARRLHELKAGLRLADRRGGSAGSRELQWGDVAILARTRVQVSKLVGLLRQGGVPCETSSGQRLFDAPETLELAALLRVVCNPRDEISLAAVLKSPLCGIDDADLLRLRRDHANIAEALMKLSFPRRGLGPGSRTPAAALHPDPLRVPCRPGHPAGPVPAGTGGVCVRVPFVPVEEQRRSARPREPRPPSRLDRAARGTRPGRRGRGVRGSRPGLRHPLCIDESLGRWPGPAIRSSPDDARSQGPGIPRCRAGLAAKRPARPRPGAAVLGGSRHRSPLAGGRWTTAPRPTAPTASRISTTSARSAREADRLLYVAMTRAEEYLVLSASFPPRCPEEALVQAGLRATWSEPERGAQRRSGGTGEGSGALPLPQDLERPAGRRGAERGAQATRARDSPSAGPRPRKPTMPRQSPPWRHSLTALAGTSCRDTCRWSKRDGRQAPSGRARKAIPVRETVPTPRNSASRSICISLASSTNPGRRCAAWQRSSISTNLAGGPSNASRGRQGDGYRIHRRQPSAAGTIDLLFEEGWRANTARLQDGPSQAAGP